MVYTPIEPTETELAEQAVRLEQARLQKEKEETEQMRELERRMIGDEQFELFKKAEEPARKMRDKPRDPNDNNEGSDMVSMR